MHKSYVTTRITVLLLGLCCLGNVAGECVHPPPDGFYGWDGRFVTVIYRSIEMPKFRGNVADIF